MKLLVTAWPRINGVKHNPGDEVEVGDEALARMLIRDGQCRQAGTPEPMPAAQPATEPAAQPAATGAQPDSSGRPGRGADKDTWVAHAVANGMDEAEARSMTRGELAARFAGS